MQRLSLRVKIAASESVLSLSGTVSRERFLSEAAVSLY